MAWLARALATGFGRAPLVSIVTLRGQIAPPARGPRRVLNAARAAPWLDRAFGLNPDAVALRVSSPGGSPAQTELLVEAVARRASASGVPVYAFAEDVAASGGLWLLAAANTAGAYALPTSLVGSIGVVAPSFGAVQALTRLGLERRVWTAGDEKVGVDPFLPVPPKAEQRLNDILADLHESFKDVIKRTRGPALAKAAGGALTPDREADLFSGRVWTGTQAAAIGLVDGVGSIHSVLGSKFGTRKPVFVECGELPPGRGLFGAVAGLPAAAVDDVLAAVDERVAYARVGV